MQKSILQKRNQQVEFSYSNPISLSPAHELFLQIGLTHTYSMTRVLSCQDLPTARTSIMAEKHMGMYLYTNSYTEQKVYTSKHGSEYPKGNAKPSNIQRVLIVTKPDRVSYPSHASMTYP